MLCTHDSRILRFDSTAGNNFPWAGGLQIQVYLRKVCWLDKTTMDPFEAATKPSLKSDCTGKNFKEGTFHFYLSSKQLPKAATPFCFAQARWEVSVCKEAFFY